MNELKEQYKQLEIDKAYNIIVDNVNEETTLLDALNIASSMYIYLFKLFIKQYKDDEYTEIENRISELENFMIWPYFTILNNVTLFEEKNIGIIIKDRYNLLNINLTKEDIEEENIDDLISVISPIKTKYYLEKNGVSIEKLLNLCEYKKILNK